MFRLIQKAVDFAEEHMLENISYEDVARQIGMSAYEFHRTFRLMTNMTFQTYIRQRRLSLAGIELQESNISVSDTAYKYRYETPESFSKSFSRFHGVSPKQARVPGVQLRMFNPLHIKVEFVGGNVLNYRIEKRERQRFIAKVRSFSYEAIENTGESGIAEFWQECHRENSVEPIRSLRPEGKRDLYGLCNASKEDTKLLDYGIGVLIDEETEAFTLEELLQKGFRIWETEAKLYVVFECYGESGACISQAWDCLYKEFLPNMRYCKLEDTDYEIYYEKGKTGLFCEVWIPITEERGGY